MKLTGWLFEEQEQTEQQRKLGVVNDFVYEIFGNHTFFPSIKEGNDDKTWILKTDFNNQPGVDLYLTYSNDGLNRSMCFKQTEIKETEDIKILVQ